MLQEKYQKAIRFAGEKHCNQNIPGSEANYLVHLSNVAMEILVAYKNDGSFNIDLAVQLALLHDCLEDTSTTVEELSAQFGVEVCVGVEALTKNSVIESKTEKMNDSLQRIKGSFMEVRLVKIADRITNLQKPPKTWGKDKIEKYLKEAKQIYNELSGENEYLDRRLESKIEEYKKYWDV